MIEHSHADANRARFHVASTGAGSVLLLLHGWPEFWLTWRPVMDRLGGRFRLVAPDLRGFGDSNKPPDAFGPARHAADMAALIEAMHLALVGVVGHDVRASVAQERSPTRPPGRRRGSTKNVTTGPATTAAPNTCSATTRCSTTSRSIGCPTPRPRPRPSTCRSPLPAFQGHWRPDAPLGRDPVPPHRVMARSGQRRAFRGVRTAEDLRRRGTCRLRRHAPSLIAIMRVQGHGLIAQLRQEISY